MAIYIWPPLTISPPVGGATAANQVLEIADLDAIKASVASIDTKTTSLATAANQASLITAVGLLPKLTDTQPVIESDFSASGNITTQNLNPTGTATANSAVEVSTIGKDTVGIQVTGTFSGSLAISYTVDGTNWVLMTGALMRVTKDGSIVTTITATGIYNVACPGMLKIRVEMITSMTGTAVITLKASKGSSLTSDALAGTQLTNILAKLPSSLGQKTMANSLAITLASDQSSIPVTVSGVATAANQATEISSLSSIDTKLSSQATAANQTTGNTSVASIDTNQGAKADTVATTDTGTFSLIALVKKVAQNITNMSAKLPAALGITTAANSLSIAPASDAIFNVKPKALTNSYAEILAQDAITAGTFTAPANAIGGKIYAKDTNGANVRWKAGATATISSGLQLQPGRAEDFNGGSNVSIMSESGTNEVNIIWTIQA